MSDRTTFQLMAECLDSFNEGHTSVGRVVSRIDELIGSLVETDQTVKGQLFDAWSSMEQAWAFHLASDSREIAPRVTEHVRTEARLLANLIHTELEREDRAPRHS